jgi:hypothetical protein
MTENLKLSKIITDILIEILTSEDRTYFKEKFNIFKMKFHLASRLKLNVQY